METYYLNTIIFFLKTQQELNYCGIEALLSVIDCDEISDSHKRKMIIEILQDCGLNDLTHKSGRFEPTHYALEEDLISEVEEQLQKQMKEEKKTTPDDSQEFKLEFFGLTLMNGQLILGVPLN